MGIYTSNKNPKQYLHEQEVLGSLRSVGLNVVQVEGPAVSLHARAVNNVDFAFLLKQQTGLSIR